jgi:hypothetical protein
MALIPMIKKIGVGAGVAVVAVTALPIAGAVGTITATGAAVASILGGIAGAIDHIHDEKPEKTQKHPERKMPVNR